MAGITLAQAESQLSTWMSALEKIASSQSYSIGDRTLTRANLREVQSMVNFWDKKVQVLSRGGKRVVQVTPVSN